MACSRAHRAALLGVALAVTAPLLASGAAAQPVAPPPTASVATDLDELRRSARELEVVVGELHARGRELEERRRREQFRNLSWAAAVVLLVVLLVLRFARARRAGRPPPPDPAS